MPMSEPQKTFDCVEFKRQAQVRIYERIKNMTPDQEIDYFRKAAETGPLGEWWRKIVAGSSETRVGHARSLPDGSGRASG